MCGVTARARARPARLRTDADARSQNAGAELLRRAVNATLLSEAVAYLTVYSLSPARHRRALRAIASDARDKRLRVWAADESDNFELVDHDSIGPPDSALILPRLFRRCSDYLRARAGGFHGVLPEWLVATSPSGRRPETTCC